MLASGQLPYEQAPIYEAETPVTIGLITFVNKDSGTDFATINLWIKPRKGTAVSIQPVDLYLDAGGMHEVLQPRTLQPGDQLLGKVSAGSFIDFTVNRHYG